MTDMICKKESYHVEQKNFLSLSVYNTGYQKCEPGHQWGPGIRDHYLIHYINAGKGYFKTNGQTFLLGKGDAFLVYPQSEATYYADISNPWEYYWVGFQGSDASALIEATDFSPVTPVFYHCHAGERIKEQFSHIYKNRGNRIGNSALMTGSLYHALSLFIQDSAAKKTPSSSTAPVELAISFIASQYSYPITVEDIASYIGISRSQLFREFAERLEQSPKEFLTQYRIRQACRLLEETPLSIQSIANSVGYENGMYFSKVFHSKMNLTPTAYRQKYLTSR